MGNQTERLVSQKRLRVHFDWPSLTVHNSVLSLLAERAIILLTGQKDMGTLTFERYRVLSRYSLEHDTMLLAVANENMLCHEPEDGEVGPILIDSTVSILLMHRRADGDLEFQHIVSLPATQFGDELSLVELMECYRFSAKIELCRRDKYPTGYGFRIRFCWEAKKDRAEAWRSADGPCRIDGASVYVRLQWIVKGRPPFYLVNIHELEEG